MAVQDRRRALIDAAVRVIARDGVAGATTRAVVAEAGMSLASLHYAFPSREHLMEAVIAEVTAQERRTAEAGLLPVVPTPGGGGPLRLEDVVRDGLERFVDLVAADPAREQALLELALYAMRTTGQRAALVAQYRVYHESARATLTAAALATGSRWTVPLDEVARALVMVTDGLTTAWLADRDTAAARETARFAARALAALAEPVDPGATEGTADRADDDQEESRAH
jgi:AcrR family transcriptional regulator